MDRQQDRPQHLAGDEQMAQVAAAVPAGQAGAVLLQRPCIFAVDRVAKLELPGVGEREAVASVARRHHAIEQVDSAGDAFQQIDRPTHAHQVTRLVFGQCRTGGGGDPIHLARAPRRR